jgi:protein SCO1/2
VEELDEMLAKVGSRIRKAFALVACTLSVLALPQLACKPHTAGSEQRFELIGTVVSVDKRAATVTIAHEAIPGYMEAMSMPFKLRDERLLSEMAEGDRVRATLVVAGLRSWLDDVVRTRESVDSSNLSNPDSWVEPQPGAEIPDFKLVDHNGKRMSLHQYRGQTLVLTFIYTRCPLPDYCPLITDNFSQLEKLLQSEPAASPQTHLLSITVDPEYDTPKVLHKYAAAHSMDPARWDFATGTKDEVKQIATYFGMQYWREGDQIIHSLRTAIVASDGKLVKLYRGNEWKADQVIEEVRKLRGPDGVAQKTVFHGVGTVDSVDRERAVVQIDHQDIPGAMPAMNMPYNVKDRTLLDSIASGDKVDFWLESTDAGLMVVGIKKQ